jgi:predicted secreted protein
MSLTAALAVYFILWWVVLFAILPFGVRSQHEEPGMPEGTDPGAPVAPRLLAKAIATTLISAAIFAAGYGLFASGLLRLESFPMPFALPKP